MEVALDSEEINEPHDANEPTYCICQQVSYGEMIACDNEEVCYSTVYMYDTSVKLNGSIIRVLD